MIVIGGMSAIVVALAVVRIAYEDIVAAFDQPTEQELAQAQEAVNELSKAADVLDTSDMIAGVANCEAGRKLNAVCLTVTDNWAKAHDRQGMANEIWKSWSAICTGKHLASEPRNCFIHLKSPTGETLGGSGDDDGARIWIKQ